MRADEPDQKLTQAELALLVLSAPGLLFPNPTWSWIAILIPALWVVRWWCNLRPLPRTAIDAALWPFVCTVVMSLVVTPSVGLSLGKLCGVALGVMTFWALARWATTTERRLVALAVFIAFGAAVALAGLLGTRVYSRYPLIEPLAIRLPAIIRGVPGAEDGFNPNAVSGALTLFIPLQAALLFGGAHRWRPGTARITSTVVVGTQIVLLALTVGTTVLMQSRGAWLGLCVAACAFGAWHSRRSREALVAALAIMAVGVALLGPWTTLERAFSRPGASIAGTVAYRAEVWKVGWCGVREAPLTGYGLNVFRTVRPPACESDAARAGEDIFHTHNQWLQVAVDLGVPGLLAYVGIWLLLARRITAGLRRSARADTRWIAGGLGAGFIAFAVFGIQDAIPLGAKVGWFFWIAAALVVTLPSGERRGARRSLVVSEKRGQQRVDNAGR